MLMFLNDYLSLLFGDCLVFSFRGFYIYVGNLLKYPFNPFVNIKYY